MTSALFRAQKPGKENQALVSPRCDGQRSALLLINDK